MPFSDEGEGCENIDDCEAVACGQGTCVDLVGSASCDCNAGYQDNDGDLVCEPSCDANTCDDFYACDDSSGTASCSCAPGTELVDDVCQPISCQENQFVSGNDCVTCEGGLYNAAGDSAASGDTTCDEECLSDEHCPGREVCSSNYTCIEPCANHQECIDLYREDTNPPSDDYACVQGHCVGMSEAQCYIDQHCLNDGDLANCLVGDSANPTTPTELGTCVECLDSEDCGADARCTDNVCQDRNFVCQTHQNCIDEWSDAENSDYGCVDSSCVGLLAGRCYVDAHCANDEGKAYCDGDENREGDCRQCVIDDHCEGNETCNDAFECVASTSACTNHTDCINGGGDLRNENGACREGVCQSMAAGNCYIDTHCGDDTDSSGTPTLVCNGSSSPVMANTGDPIGSCIMCVEDEDCEGIMETSTPEGTIICTTTNICAERVSTPD